MIHTRPTRVRPGPHLHEEGEIENPPKYAKSKRTPLTSNMETKKIPSSRVNGSQFREEEEEGLS